MQEREWFRVSLERSSDYSDQWTSRYAVDYATLTLDFYLRSIGGLRLGVHSPSNHKCWAALRPSVCAEIYIKQCRCLLLFFCIIQTDYAIMSVCERRSSLPFCLTLNLSCFHLLTLSFFINISYIQPLYLYSCLLCPSLPFFCSLILFSSSEYVLAGHKITQGLLCELHETFQWAQAMPSIYLNIYVKIHFDLNVYVYTGDHPVSYLQLEHI